MNVLVIGGTGTTGSRLAALLPNARIGTRKPTRDDHVRFDWDDPATFEDSLRGIDGVYLIPPVGVVDPLPVVESFLARARLVRRVVLLSSSAVRESATGMGALPALVRTMPEWAVLRPSWFMQNFTGDHAVAAGVRAGQIVTATGDGRVGFVDAADIAAVAARALLDPLPHNTDHLITGPEALSYADAAAIMTEVTGRPVRHRSVSTEELSERLAAWLPPEFAAVLAGLDEDIRGGAEDRVSTTVLDVTGRPARSFRDFISRTSTG
ncbi:ergot alkaloid biosynthesis protein [Lentzea sp. BCCO 10_0856]|uniref:Ergot alkaloid biosynthesis protein n=1 Tax=Lentzea miocenica TaxID=3095431 RepID=A0ABU4T435_9PSEU|nr:ergot alkaloid biosynthesis protein [Lentzea sp. BCCO 10_0856]MDX8032917.1 ergot alkaloid biosynthesis protein [Lentzea sp. BCCO 10_0856]